MALNYYDTSSVITTSQPTELDPESVLYQSEDVWKKYKRLSRRITVVCVGPGILYVRASHDGTYFSEEAVIYEGQSKDYDEIYVLKLRSPSANLRYRVTEYNVTTVSGQQFSGSRFKDRRDRNGVIVFQDDYESPTIKFEVRATTPGFAIRSNTTAYAGDFSIRTQGGPSFNPNHLDTISLVYIHPDFHIGKIANQIHFAVDPPPNTVAEANLKLDYFNGTNRYFSIVTLDTLGNVTIAIKNVPFVPPFYYLILVKTGVIIRSSIFSWNVMKLSIDIAALKYVAAFVNGQRIDLSGFDLPYEPSTLAPSVESIIQNTTISTNKQQDIFFDNYLFTEDETFV